MDKEENLRDPLVRNYECSEGDVETATPAWKQLTTTIKSRSNNWPRYGALVVMFSAVSITSCYIGTRINLQRPLDTECSKHTSQWSPLLRDVGIKYSPRPFDGSFMEENIFRKNGSPEVDAAWNALGVDYRAGVILEEDGLRSGLDDSFVQRAEKHGGGFFVNVEGLHHLHCLNLVRKALYFNYDYYKAMGMHAFQNEEHILRLHVTHCLDTIRQVLMCNIDTGMLGQVWVDPNEPIAFPDFKTIHICKNFDDVRNWAEKLQAPPTNETPEDYLAPPKEEMKPGIPRE